MTKKIPAESTYVAPFTIYDGQGNKLSLSGASVDYRMTESRGGVNEVVRYDETDEEITIEPDGDKGIVRVEIPATETDVVGEVWEELRVSFSSKGSKPVVQRNVYFEPSTTSPP